MKKILIIDDSAFMRGVLKDVLQSDDIKFYEADGKDNALKQLKKVHPQLILLDIVMKNSETEGLEFIKEIKNYFDVNKIIIISSVGQAFLQEEIEKLGIQWFIQKPFEEEVVKEKVKQALQN